MWCGGWEATRNCAGFPSNYRCNPATGAPTKRQRDVTCDRNCRCIPKCSFVGYGIGSVKLCGLPSLGDSINVVDETGTSVGTIESVTLDGAAPGTKREEVPSTEAPAIGARADETQGLYNSWYLSCTIKSMTAQCKTYGYECNPKNGAPMLEEGYSKVQPCERGCTCKPICTIYGSSSGSMPVCAGGVSPRNIITTKEGSNTDSSETASVDSS